VCVCVCVRVYLTSSDVRIELDMLNYIHLCLFTVHKWTPLTGTIDWCAATMSSYISNFSGIVCGNHRLVCGNHRLMRLPPSERVRAAGQKSRCRIGTKYFPYSSRCSCVSDLVLVEMENSSISIRSFCYNVDGYSI